MEFFDAIVLGSGGMGSATLSALARRGQKVLGLEQFSFVHDQGSSHGATRIIRQAYFEHVDYVPLLRRAYELWQGLEARSGQRFFYRNGLALFAPPDSETARGVRAARDVHSIVVEEMHMNEARKRWPLYEAPDNCRVLFEPGAGFLEVEKAVSLYLEEARRDGAMLREHERVLSWKKTGDSIELRTDKGTYAAACLIVTAGAWAMDFLKDVLPPLRVQRKHLFWVQAPHQYDRKSEKGLPCFYFERPEGHFYGFPCLDDGAGLKIAEHSGGEDLAGNPAQVDRSPSNVEWLRSARCLRENFPSLPAENYLSHAVCLYTLSPDHHFLVDRHPECPEVVFAAGFSGHGFKFASVMGELLADLALEGKSQLPWHFLSLKRLDKGFV